MRWSCALLALLVSACSDYTLEPSNDVLEGGDTSSRPTNTDDSGVDCSTFAPDLPPPPQIDGDCMAEPAVGSFTPVLEWQWTGNPVQPGYDDIMAAPAIANLTDDDGDGDIDEDDVPDIVFTTFSGGHYSSTGPLVAISGDGSGTHWSVSSAGGYAFGASSGVAIGDLEGDGSPDLCAAGDTIAVICVEADGSFKWAAGSELARYGMPSIHDMDGDGRAEVIFGRQIFDASGNVLGMGSHGTGSEHYASFAVDADGDGVLEVVAGNAVYEMDGSTTWNDGGLNGYPAVADFDGDGDPEIVRVGSGLVELVDLVEGVKWQVSLPGGGNGGPPTIADFDGDGWPEVGVAAKSYYSVYDTDGEVLWTNPTEDDSSSQTGSSVFDFEGDGAFEVVYADEHTLWIYDGGTGAVLLQYDEHSSGTLMEYPLVADVDGDDSTEIVFACNDYSIPGCNGITVLGDASGSWAPARPVWNQHAYFITNVENDGSIPTVQDDNWSTWNTFRAGGSDLGPGHWQADLSPTDPQSCLLECDQGVVALAAGVENRGLLAGRDFWVAGKVGGVVVFEERIEILGAGESALVGPFTLTEEEWGTGSLEIVVDDGNELDECDESNNRMSLGSWPCE